MVDYLLRNSLNPGKVVKCAITFRQLVNKGGEGELIWVVELRTTEPHKNGGDIPPVFINTLSINNLDEVIREATEQIAEQINWAPLDDDFSAPYVIYSSPSKGEQDVDIYSKLIIDLEERLPASGIDPDSIEVIINEIDVTSEIELIGDPYSYRIIWEPSIRVLDTY